MRVLAQVMLDWLENSLLEPVIVDPRVVDFLEEWVRGNDLRYSMLVKANMQKVAFKIIEKIVNYILAPLMTVRDFHMVTARIVIALLGMKHKWKEAFEGRNMVRMVFKEKDIYEKKLAEVLTNWTQTLTNSINL